MHVETDKVLKEAYENRSDAIAFVRRIAEAKRDVAKAKGDNGLNATLTARLGYSKSAGSISKVYHSPQDQQLMQLNSISLYWIGEDQNPGQTQRRPICNSLNMQWSRISKRLPRK
jgi:hypothetical protein